MNCSKCKKKDLVSKNTVDINIYDGLIPSDHDHLAKPDCDFDDRFSLCQECYKKLLLWKIER
jgi:hypothetical protein